MTKAQEFRQYAKDAMLCVGLTRCDEEREQYRNLALMWSAAALLAEGGLSTSLVPE